MRNLYPEYTSLIESMHQNTQLLMMNSFMEEYAAVNEGDTEFKFPEVSMESSLEREREYLEALDLTICRVNKEILDKFSEGALSKNPIGLTLDYFTENDISGKYEEYSKTLMRSLKVALESGDTSAISSVTTCISGKGSDVTTVLRNTVCCGKKVDGCLDMILNKEYGKPITKDCVKEAVTFLESGCSEKLKEIKKITDEKCKSYKEKACNMKNDMDKAAKIVHGQCKKEGCKSSNESYEEESCKKSESCSKESCKKEGCSKESCKKEGCNKESCKNNESCKKEGCSKESCKKEGCKNAKNCTNEAVASCFAVNTYLMEQDFLDHSYVVTLENQLLEMLTQARKVVMCVHDYDPRNYVESLASVQEMAENIEESCNKSYDACLEMNMEEYLIEAGFKEKIDSLRSRFVASNKRFLNKYEDRALKSSCSGLVMDKWYTFADLDKKYKDTLKKIQDLFKGTNTDDVDKLKAAYKDLKDKGFGLIPGKVAKANSTFFTNDGSEGKVIVSYASIGSTLTRNHKVTKQDVKDAVNILKDVGKEITEARNAFQKSNLGMQFAGIHGPSLGTKSEKYQNKLTNLKKDYADLLDNNYKGALYWQLVAKQQQARKVVLMAARDVKTENAMFDDELISLIEEAYSYINL